MKEFILDGSAWRTWDDMYDALFAVLGAPAWHGRNLNALYDSMVVGGINELRPPARVQIVGTRAMSDEVRDMVAAAVETAGRPGNLSSSYSGRTHYPRSVLLPLDGANVTRTN